MSAETSSVNLSEEGGPVESAENKEESDSKKNENVDAVQMLSTTEADELCGWLKITLGDKRVREVRTTTRLSGSPAIITDHESGAMRRMLKMVVSQLIVLYYSRIFFYSNPLILYDLYYRSRPTLERVCTQTYHHKFLKSILSTHLL